MRNLCAAGLWHPANFKQSLIPGVPVRINETSRQDVKLDVSNIKEAVLVMAAPSLINPVSSVMRQSIDVAILAGYRSPRRTPYS